MQTTLKNTDGELVSDEIIFTSEKCNNCRQKKKTLYLKMDTTGIVNKHQAMRCCRNPECFMYVEFKRLSTWVEV